MKKIRDFIDNGNLNLYKEVTVLEYSTQAEDVTHNSKRHCKKYSHCFLTLAGEELQVESSELGQIMLSVFENEGRIGGSPLIFLFKPEFSGDSANELLSLSQPQNKEDRDYTALKGLLAYSQGHKPSTNSAIHLFSESSSPFAANSFFDKNINDICATKAKRGYAPPLVLLISIQGSQDEMDVHLDNLLEILSCNRI